MVDEKEPGPLALPALGNLARMVCVILFVQNTLQCNVLNTKMHVQERKQETVSEGGAVFAVAAARATALWRLQMLATIVKTRIANKGSKLLRRFDS